MVFFQGTLQEGIAAALQQGKSVVCFVTDGEAESQQWEDDFFAEEEASFSQTLKEYIAAGVSKDEFVRRMKAALTTPQPPAAQPAAPEPQPAAPPVAAAASQPSHAEESSASSSGQATPPSPTDSRVRALLAERAARLQQQKNAEEEAAKRQRAEKAKAAAEAEASGRKQPSEQSKHAAALRKRQQEAREERQRILKAIEDNKAARRAERASAEAARKAAAAEAEAAASEQPASAPFAPASPLLPSTNRLSEHCSIQVRLLDGSTIRSRFSSDETLADVRRWVDETRRDGPAPYAFKVLLTPLPSRTIDAAEERKSLRELELAPSATLILLRAHKPAATAAAAAAYPSSAGGAALAEGNIFQRLVAYILAVISGVFGTIYAFFSTFFSTAGPAAAPPEAASAQTSQSRPAGDAARRRGGRIAGLVQADEPRNDQQFYNGNSPRADDGE
ncbi:uncharacterized protein THITE_2044263 [Thermothielavioides terrestris NRRL 8126]|uniref:UBX domain-containing protein n=1 Tax=Thermothielavioides terrestris (strain ATCC 38088 / NRRL 8126) TaxID=578455 RepID=G2R3Q4_THETT|nr:uncharacterized protein THITE_2044263 [Thermothielavioides terrestris NRRL 8126]AEO65154.1 hypothetical protein THITE_2044263 [Thermothielavioides terrestris NRRL 8126]